VATACGNDALVEGYDYDAQGRRVSEFNSLRGISGRTAVYDDDRLVASGDYAYTFDADGFLTSKTDTVTQETTTYAYARTGQLNNVQLPDGTLIEYLHNALGQRVAKKVDGIITEKYLWAGVTGLLAVYDSSDNLVIRFEGAKVVKDGQTYYLITDQIGSVRAVADATGNVLKEITYDSFGNILDDTNPAFTVPLGFAGGLHDRDTGLVRFGFRDYDPDPGTWTAKDPILFGSGDTYLYEYCSNDPINHIDPTGLETFLTSWIPTQHLSSLANFAAGFGDSLSFGITDLAREYIFGGNKVISRCSGAYFLGATTEMAAELAITGGGSALRHSASKASRSIARAEARRIARRIARGTGKIAHHRQSLFGHFGGKPSLFPTGGLPARIHSSRLNLQLVDDVADHARLHRRLAMEERALSNATNPRATTIRAASYKIRMNVFQ